MGYRSQVYLKTTTEGWLIMKKFNDSITEWEDQPLSYSEVYRTPKGNYKITFDDIKWYTSYTQIQNFNKVLGIYEEQDIPYSFIRIGEEEDDIEHKRNYPDDIPYEIEAFEPVVDINDEEYHDYEKYEDHLDPAPAAGESEHDVKDEGDDV